MRFVFVIIGAALLVPVAGNAQAVENLLGVYVDPSGDPASTIAHAASYTPFTAYLVVTNPVNYDFDDGTGILTSRPVKQVSGFECQVRWGDATVTVLSTTIPNLGTDFGTVPNIIVEYNTPVLVAAGSAVLLTWSLIVGDVDPHYVYMNITTNSSIPGAMAVVDAEDMLPGLVAVMPWSGHFFGPVFGINIHVATESATWGGVKTLFR